MSDHIQLISHLIIIHSSHAAHWIFLCCHPLHTLLAVVKFSQILDLFGVNTDRSLAIHQGEWVYDRAWLIRGSLIQWFSWHFFNQLHFLVADFGALTVHYKVRIASTTSHYIRNASPIRYMCRAAISCNYSNRLFVGNSRVPRIFGDITGLGVQNSFCVDLGRMLTDYHVLSVWWHSQSGVSNIYDRAVALIINDWRVRGQTWWSAALKNVLRLDGRCLLLFRVNLFVAMFALNYNLKVLIV